MPYCGRATGGLGCGYPYSFESNVSKCLRGMEVILRFLGVPCSVRTNMALSPPEKTRSQPLSESADGQHTLTKAGVGTDRVTGEQPP